MASTNWDEGLDDLLKPKPDPEQEAAIRAHYSGHQERELKAAHEREELPAGLKVVDVPGDDDWHSLELRSQDGTLKFGSIQCKLAVPVRGYFWSDRNLPPWIRDALDGNSSIVVFDYPKSAVESEYKGLLKILIGMAGRFASVHDVAGIACYASTIDDKYRKVGLVELGPGTFGCDTDNALSDHDAELNRITDWPDHLR